MVIVDWLISLLSTDDKAKSITRRQQGGAIVESLFRLLFKIRQIDTGIDRTKNRRSKIAFLDCSCSKSPYSLLPTRKKKIV